MNEDKPRYDASGLAVDGRQLAARLREMWRELGQAQPDLSNDALRADVFDDLGEAMAALQRAVEKLFVDSGDRWPTKRK